MFEIDRNVRILAIAYGCEPGEGSDPGAGWIWSRMLARLGETWVITRSNNRSAIEEGLRNLSLDVSPRFVYVDLPEWARFWKRGQRGIRLYYLLWQIAALAGPPVARTTGLRSRVAPHARERVARLHWLPPPPNLCLWSPRP